VIVIGRNVNYKQFAGESYFSSVSDAKSAIKKNSSNAYVVIDLAYTSVPNTSYDDPVKDFSENLNNVINHLLFVEEIGAEKYIYVSSGGTVYGNVNADIITEDASNFPLSPYGITKMACERYVHLYNKTHNIFTCILRPSNVYGPGQKPFRGQGFIATALGLAYKNLPVTIYGTGSQVRDNIFIDDFCRGVFDVIEYGENGGIYNVSEGKGMSNLEVLNNIQQLVKGDLIELEKKYLPERKFDVQKNVLDYSRLSALNNWRPEISFEEGLKKTALWIKQFLNEH